jgi:hypothetical protein
VDRAVGAERHRVSELLLGLGRAEREHDRLAAVGLDQADGLLEAALLVRADREAEVLRLDRLRVVRGTILPPVIGTRFTQTRILTRESSCSRDRRAGQRRRAPP